MDLQHPVWHEIKHELGEIRAELRLILAGLSDIQTAQQAEHTDLVTLTGLVTQLLTAFASGTLSPTDAQNLVDAITSDDATVKTSIGSIQAALAPTTPPATPPASS